MRALLKRVTHFGNSASICPETACPTSRTKRTWSCPDSFAWPMPCALFGPKSTLLLELGEEVAVLVPAGVHQLHEPDAPFEQPAGIRQLFAKVPWCCESGP